MQRQDQLIPFLSREKIQDRVSVIAEEINNRHAHTECLYVLCVLRGAFIFCADLVRQLRVPLRMDFISLSSYGDGRQSKGRVSVTDEMRYPCAGMPVLVVEDIVDSGHTMNFLRPHLSSERGARQVEIATLLSKPSRREVDVSIDYLGFEIEDKFVVGYGLDDAGRFRELPSIAEVGTS